jgi:hypothetical protein
MLSSRNAWRIGTIRAAQRLLQPLPRPSSSATTLKTSVDDIRCDPPRLIFAEQLGRPASAPAHPRKKSPGGISPRGFIVSGAGSAFLHRPFPEVRRFISRNQVKMKLASGSPSGLVGGSTAIFSNAVLAPPLDAPSATADRLRRAPSLNRPGARPCLPLACNPMPGLYGKARDR